MGYPFTSLMAAVHFIVLSEIWAPWAVAKSSNHVMHSPEFFAHSSTCSRLPRY